MFQKTNKKVVYFGWNTTLHAAIKCTKQYYYLKNLSIKTVEQDLDEKKSVFVIFRTFENQRQIRKKLSDLVQKIGARFENRFWAKDGVFKEKYAGHS